MTHDPEAIRILILDDEKEFTEELHEFFVKSGFHSHESNTREEALAILKGYPVDLMVLDVRLVGCNGLDVLQEVKSEWPDLEVVVISAHGDMDTVIRAMRLGAFDYLRKPFRHLDIQIVIERTRKYLQMQRRLRLAVERNSLISKSLEEKIDRHFIGVSRRIREVFDQAVKAADYPDANVLITGESGTGKENIARIIHYAGARKDHVFCAVNSSAITETLLESEFFGHRKGSFTGAVSDKMGFFEACNGGTLFLDEIADMPLTLQAKILRAAEEKVITRVGDTKPVRTDFRIISSTNHDLGQFVRDNKFRLDLLHRLNTVHIHLPPLRERPEDIPPLLDHFLELFSKKLNRSGIRAGATVYSHLAGYSFPGNVRELKNMTERALILCKRETLLPDDFPLSPSAQGLSDPDGGRIPALREAETELVRRAMEATGGNQVKAAALLGITRDALIRKLRKYQIAVPKSGR